MKTPPPPPPTPPPPPPTGNILSLSALSLSRSLARGDLSCVDLMQATLDRIDKVNPSVNAIVSLRNRHDLLQEARKCDEETSRRRSRQSQAAPSSSEAAAAAVGSGWLRGIPMAIKDLSNVKGIPTTMGGSQMLMTNNDDYQPAAESDLFVQRLQDAGAIMIGKTNAPESGLGSHTTNRQFGTTRNPYNLTSSAGGSSGGAAAAVASRMLCLADGSDMMGSLRNPAGWNNLYSLRPTAAFNVFTNDNQNDIVKRRRTNPLPYPISTVGPIARDVNDLSALFKTMKGEFVSLEEEEEEEDEPLVQQKQNSRPWRIAWLGDWSGAHPMEKGVLEHCRQRLDAAASWSSSSSSSSSSAVSIEIHDIVNDIQSMFDAHALWQSWTTIRSAVISQQYVDNYGKEDVSSSGSDVNEHLQWEVARGLEITDQELQEAVATAQEWSTFLNETIFSKYDVIALPSAQVWPFDLNNIDDVYPPKQIEGRTMDTYHRWMQVAVPVSLAGLPCVTVPAGLAQLDKLQEPSPPLPLMGIQLAGRRGEDERLLTLARVFHAERDWPNANLPLN